MKHLKMIFERLSLLGIVINPSKYKIGNATGISPSPTKTKAVPQFPISTNMKSL